MLHYLVFLSKSNNLRTFINNQVFQWNTNNLHTGIHGFIYSYQVLIIFKKICSTHRLHPYRYCHTGPSWNYESWQWRDDTKLPWSPELRPHSEYFFLDEGILPHYRKYSQRILNPPPTRWKIFYRIDFWS